jgi:hypothetical protein
MCDRVSSIFLRYTHEADLMQEKRMHTIIHLILAMVLCIVPACAGAGERNTSPLWSDALGNTTVLVACSADGSSVVAGTGGGQVIKYDTTGNITWTYRTDGRSITSVSVSGDGRITTATTGDTVNEGKILIFDDHGGIIREFSTNAAVNRAVVSKDGSTIFGSSDDTLYTFNAKGDLLEEKTVNGSIWDVSVSTDGGDRAAAVDSGWAERTGSIVILNRDIPGSAVFPTVNRGRSIGISADGSSIAGLDEYRLYSLSPNGTLRWSFESSPPFRDIAVSSDGRSFVSGSQYFLRLFNESGSLLWEYRDPGYFGSVAISGKGDTIIAGSSDRVRLFDRNGHLLWEEFTGGPSSVSAAADGEYFAVGTDTRIIFFSTNGSVTKPEITGSNIVQTSPVPAGVSPAPTQAPVSPGIAVGALTGYVLWLRLVRKR